MKQVFSFFFIFLAVVLLTSAVASVTQLNSSLTNQYVYAESEKGQIITIDSSKFQIIKNVSENKYKIIASNLGEVVLDGNKFGLSDLFKNWESQTTDNTNVTLLPSADCKFLNFVLSTKKVTLLEDALEYVYCTVKVDPEYKAI